MTTILHRCYIGRRMANRKILSQFRYRCRSDWFLRPCEQMFTRLYFAPVTFLTAFSSLGSFQSSTSSVFGEVTTNRGARVSQFTHTVVCLRVSGYTKVSPLSYHGRWKGCVYRTSRSTPRGTSSRMELDRSDPFHYEHSINIE